MEAVAADVKENPKSKAEAEEKTAASPQDETKKAPQETAAESTTAATEKLPPPSVAVVVAAKAHSDGEGGTTPQPLLKKITKKRRTLGGGNTSEGGEDRIRLKRRKIKVAGAPKMPLTGYVRYMNDRREMLKKEFPAKTAIEHTKIIGEEWNQLSEDRKTPYMKAAEIDKQRYLDELHTFLKANPDVLASELAKNKKVNKTSDDKTGSGTAAPAVLKEKSQPNGNTAAAPKAGAVAKDANVNKEKQRHLERDNTPPAAPPPKRKRTPTPTTAIATAAATAAPTIAAPTFTAPVPGEIPIFTNDFLENNKSFDLELRTLRKTKTDLEQQNAVLEKHVENMKFGVEKMVSENDELQEKNRLLEIYLDKLKRKLVHALADLGIPSEPQGATIENIEKYMDDLYKMATTNTHGPASLNKAKDIIRKLDLQIQL